MMYTIDMEGMSRVRFWRRVAMGAVLACAFLSGMVAAAVYSSVGG